MIDDSIKYGNFYNLWALFSKIISLLVLNHNYLDFSKLKNTFYKIKQQIIENNSGLYSSYHLI